MSLADIVRDGIALANDQTAELQPEVSLQRWAGEDSYGDASLSPVETYSALVDQTQKVRMSPSGVLVATKALVTILQPLAANGAAHRVEPIDPRDVLTLPDGTTGPILYVNAIGGIDPETDLPYGVEVALGV